MKLTEPLPYVALATSEELKDKNSWVNNEYEVPTKAYIEFFMALGEGTAAWALLEGALVTILHGATRPIHRGAISAGYNALATFRTKLDFVDATVRSTFADASLIEEWSTLFNKLTKKNKKRNAMAHGTVYYDHNAASLNRKYFVPATVSGDISDKRLYASDLKAIKNSFERLRAKCLEFSQEVWRQEALLSPKP